MMQLTSWINEEFGDKDLLDRREKIIQEFKSAEDDVSKLRKLMHKVRSINTEIECLTIARKNHKQQPELKVVIKQDSVNE